VDAFLNLVTSPAIASDLPFGVIMAKKSDGTLVELPNVMRLMTASRIIQQYELFLLEEGLFDTLRLSHSTYRKILKACKASVRKSAHGLDYFLNDVLEAFDDLESIISKHVIDDDHSETKKQMITTLRESKNYLRVNYKIHAKVDSRVSDHCQTHSLSDPNNDAFEGNPKEAHQHDLACQFCDELKSLLRDVDEIVQAIPDASEKVRQLEIFRQASMAVEKFKSHQLRTVAQSRAHSTRMESLRDGFKEAFVTMDWAMKFEPSSGREDSRSWFGKRGISWHVASVYMRDPDYFGHPLDDQQFMEKIFIHVNDNSKQRAADIAPILFDVCMRLKHYFPQLEMLFIKSDKAKCYHNPGLFGTIHLISQRCGIRIARWDFTEPQSGKGSCDRAAARSKMHVRRSMAERHSCASAQEFVQCLTSQGGMKGVAVIRGKALRDDQTVSFQWKGIDSYNNFEFTDEGVKYFKSFGIGEGALKAQSEWGDNVFDISFVVEELYEEGHTGSAILRSNPLQYWRKASLSYGQRRNAQGLTQEASIWVDYKQRMADDQAQATAQAMARTRRRASVRHLKRRLLRAKRQAQAAESRIPLLYHCNEPGCIKSYYSLRHLDTHMSVGKHQYEPTRQTLQDYSLQMYAAALESQNMVPLRLFSEKEPAFNHFQSEWPPLPVGWALARPPKRGHQLNQKQRKHIADLFWAGETTKSKANPAQVAAAMRMDSKFLPSEWLKASQVLSQFSRLAKELRQRGRNELAPQDQATRDEAEKEASEQDPTQDLFEPNKEDFRPSSLEATIRDSLPDDLIDDD
jgi:hypothetical protein